MKMRELEINTNLKEKKKKERKNDIKRQHTYCSVVNVLLKEEMKKEEVWRSITTDERDFKRD